MISRSISFGGKGRGGWPAAGLDPAIAALLSTPDALPILQAISVGNLAMKDHAPIPAAPIPGYDVLYDSVTDGNVRILYPSAPADTFDTSPGAP